MGSLKNEYIIEKILEISKKFLKVERKINYVLVFEFIQSAYILYYISLLESLPV